jgi:uncharacterized peroxidase-related enzyme
MKLLGKTTSTLAMILALTLNLNADTVKKETTQAPSLLSFVDNKNATGDVKTVYDEITKAWGFVPIVIKQYSLNPQLLKLQWNLYKEMDKNKNFDPKMMTMMRMVVGGSQECEYCIGLNKGMLLNMFKMPLEEVNAISKDPSSAKLDEKQKAMLLFIIKATKTPHDTTSSDIQNLKKLGWSDADIFEGVKAGTNVVAATTIIDALKLQKDF